MLQSNRNLDNIELVVGIDFGTTFSAYAYSYRYEKDKIFMNSDWPSGSRACKEITAILFNGNEEFVSFGEEAVDKFNTLSEDDEANYFFFNCFKMNLYQDKVSSSTHTFFYSDKVDIKAIFFYCHFL